MMLHIGDHIDATYMWENRISSRAFSDATDCML